MGFLSNMLMHPEMLALGALAISVPIIIHLLNRRRFKEVDWAAMEFLLDAEQKNRKRVRLEHLILLLLRCLTMLLIGMLIARPFLPSTLTASLFDTQQFERILLIDDSMSTQARSGNREAFELAKENLVELVQSLSTNDTDDTATLLLMSRPEDPVFAARPVTSDTLQEWIDQIQELAATDLAVDLSASLAEIQRYVDVPRQDVNRVVYVMSDLLDRDWKPNTDEENASQSSPHEQLNAIGEKVAGVFLVNIGVDQQANLSIESVTPPEVFIAGVSNRIDIAIHNHGPREIQQARVRLTVGEALPIEETIDSLPAGETVEIGIPVTLGTTAFTEEDPWSDEAQVQDDVFHSVPVQAELIGVAPEDDILSKDSIGWYAARVARGIPVLLVDGDPSSDRERSETIFLERAIQPPGDVPSGNLVDVIDFVEFDKVPLSRYRVIGLCNVDQLSPQRLEELHQWVNDGGGLMIFPGGRTDAALFNEQLYDNGQGLSPLGLDAITGDPQREQWSTFEISESPHQVLRIFEGQDNPFVQRVKLFNYWKTVVPETANFNVLAELNDADHTIAIAEKSVGEGHVITLNIPADNDWTNWPEEGLSFLMVALDMSRYLAGNLVGQSQVQVGQPIRETIDLTLFQREATLRDPLNERHPLQVEPRSGAENAPEQAVWQFDTGKTEYAGLYDLSLRGTDEQEVTRLFAANTDPQESRLERLDLQQARQTMFGEQIELIEQNRMTTQSVQGSQREFWRWILFGLVAFLLAEQTLARWFRSRQ
jgi:hypothetical protein